MRLVGLLDRGPVVRQRRQSRYRAALVGAAERHVLPIGLEAEFPIRPGEAVEIVRLAERWLAVEPAVGLELGERAAPGDAQHLVDQLARRHRKARVFRADPSCEAGNDLVIGAALARRLDQLGAEDDVLMAATAI